MTYRTCTLINYASNEVIVAVVVVVVATAAAVMTD